MSASVSKCFNVAKEAGTHAQTARWSGSRADRLWQSEPSELLSGADKLTSRVGLIDHAGTVLFESFVFVHPHNVTDWRTSCKLYRGGLAE